MERQIENRNQERRELSLTKLIILVCASVFIGYLYGQATSISTPDIYFKNIHDYSFNSETINKENIQLFTSRINSENIKKHLKYKFDPSYFTFLVK